MENIFATVAVITFIAFVVGLIKPSLVLMPNRKKSSFIYLLAFFASITIGSQLYPTHNSTTLKSTEKTNQEPQEERKEKHSDKKFKYASKTLKEYRNEPQYERKEIVENYVSYKDIPETETDDFYSCLSQISYTKSGDLKLGDVLGWCYADYTQDPKSLTNRINFDEFMSKFSGWDGSYRPLEKIIKENMHDESTYKHVETTYRLILDKNPHAVIETTFKGSNAYGGIVKQTISANVDIKTGQIINIISK
ncbi:MULTISPECIES: hypothetical protein [Photorhabdus]|uniref:hypothetical protein n=1 Tax=Photorhabdus TaxID=29487 RepID=UPI000DCEF813|nr:MULTISPECIES: hypothetical protein [Photorhabdus]MCT8345445.1 hypothetical protein [Photorhabdus kleinii]RAX00785.1 hypothetical protein CKY03_07430 [Photorhabdus sp. S9-53]RAX00988.1 hypothetical protein CKY05_07290 [Photorhabdus sp. S10-54]RAX05327.1 hypothetical protein CKY04_05500 [Photorhabdus sp. S8-52]